MIDYAKSAKMNETTVEELKAWFYEYPRSGKMVVAICDGCGGERNAHFYQYHEMCLKCTRATPEYRELKSKIAIKQWSDPNTRRDAGIDRFGENNPNWQGGFDTTRPWVLPEVQCRKMNIRFDGSHFHHILKDLGIYIPKELHEHFYHNIKSGQGMGEINVLAIQFINGGLEICD